MGCVKPVTGVLITTGPPSAPPALVRADAYLRRAVRVAAVRLPNSLLRRNDATSPRHRATDFPSGRAGAVAGTAAAQVVQRPPRGFLGLADRVALPQVLDGARRPFARVAVAQVGQLARRALAGVAVAQVADLGGGALGGVAVAQIAQLARRPLGGVAVLELVQRVGRLAAGLTATGLKRRARP